MYFNRLIWPILLGLLDGKDCTAVLERGVKTKKLPRMATVAKQLLAIPLPAISTASEQVFSLCEHRE